MGRATFPLHTYPGVREGDAVCNTGEALTTAVQVGIDDTGMVRDAITREMRSDGLTAQCVALVPRPMHDDVLVVVEGDGLPPFVRGSQPWAVASYSDLVNAWADSLTPYKKTAG